MDITSSGVGYLSTTTNGDKVNFNVYDYFGNPTAVTDYALVGDHEISSSGAATPALTTGVFPAGSTLKIVNNSYIRGAGGNGGNPGSNGGAGGRLYLLTYRLP